MGLAVAILAPIGLWILINYARQKNFGADLARTEIEHRTELLRAQLQSPFEPGSMNLTGDEFDATLLPRAAIRVSTLSNLEPGYKVLLLQSDLEKALAVRGLQSDRVLPFAEFARASSLPMPLDARPVDIEGSPHLVSIAPLWTNGPVLVVARDLDIAGIHRSAENAAFMGFAALGFSAVAVAVLVWLFGRNPGRSRRAARQTDRREREALEGKIRRWQVEAAVRQLTEAIADEIGSPLNTILGRARLEAANRACPAETRAALETIAFQAERIARLVAEMLRVTRPSRLAPGVCDLAAVTEEVLGAIGPECLRVNVPVKLEREADSAYVKIDEERAFQIVVNACLSAVEAQPEGGIVTLRIRADGHDANRSRRVLLEVEDQGRPLSGKTETELSGVSSAIDARGFGLMIARGLVVEAGGLFQLRTGAHGGALCQFTFPGGDRPSTPQQFAEASMERTS